MRLGWISCARMLPDRSMTTTTVSMCEGSIITAWGRAMAKVSAARASRSSMGGTWRRKVAPPLMATPTDFRVG
ncbi:hypothetical protein D3C72_2340260 [compost metagenome]